MQVEDKPASPAEILEYTECLLDNMGLDGGLIDPYDTCGQDFNVMYESMESIEEVDEKTEESEETEAIKAVEQELQRSTSEIAQLDIIVEEEEISSSDSKNSSPSKKSSASEEGFLERSELQQPDLLHDVIVLAGAKRKDSGEARSSGSDSDGYDTKVSTMKVNLKSKTRVTTEEVAQSEVNTQEDEDPEMAILNFKDALAMFEGLSRGQGKPSDRTDQQETLKEELDVDRRSYVLSAVQHHEKLIHDSVSLSSTDQEEVNIAPDITSVQTEHTVQINTDEEVSEPSQQEQLSVAAVVDTENLEAEIKQLSPMASDEAKVQETDDLESQQVIQEQVESRITETQQNGFTDIVTLPDVQTQQTDLQEVEEYFHETKSARLETVVGEMEEKEVFSDTCEVPAVLIEEPQELEQTDKVAIIDNTSQVETFAKEDEISMMCTTELTDKPRDSEELVSSVHEVTLDVKDGLLQEPTCARARTPTSPDSIHEISPASLDTCEPAAVEVLLSEIEKKDVLLVYSDELDGIEGETTEHLRSCSPTEPGLTAEECNLSVVHNIHQEITLVLEKDELVNADSYSEISSRDSVTSDITVVSVHTKFEERDETTQEPSLIHEVVSASPDRISLLSSFEDIAADEIPIDNILERSASSQEASFVLERQGSEAEKVSLLSSVEDISADEAQSPTDIALTRSTSSQETSFVDERQSSLPETEAMDVQVLTPADFVKVDTGVTTGTMEGAERVKQVIPEIHIDDSLVADIKLDDSSSEETDLKSKTSTIDSTVSAISLVQAVSKATEPDDVITVTPDVTQISLLEQQAEYFRYKDYDESDHSNRNSAIYKQERMEHYTAVPPGEDKLNQPATSLIQPQGLILVHPIPGQEESDLFDDGHHSPSFPRHKPRRSSSSGSEKVSLVLAKKESFETSFDTGQKVTEWQAMRTATFETEGNVIYHEESQISSDTEGSLKRRKKVMIKHPHTKVSHTFEKEDTSPTPVVPSAGIVARTDSLSEGEEGDDEKEASVSSSPSREGSNVSFSSAEDVNDILDKVREVVFEAYKLQEGRDEADSKPLEYDQASLNRSTKSDTETTPTEGATAEEIRDYFLHKDDEEFNQFNTEDVIRQLLHRHHQEHVSREAGKNDSDVTDLSACLEEVCKAMSETDSDNEQVIDEDLQTHEVTLVFAWPKADKPVFRYLDRPYREICMRRITKIRDFEIDVIEGPVVERISGSSTPMASVSGASSDNNRKTRNSDAGHESDQQPRDSGPEFQPGQQHPGDSGAAFSSDQQDTLASETKCEEVKPLTEAEHKSEIQDELQGEAESGLATDRNSPMHDSLSQTPGVLTSQEYHSTDTLSDTKPAAGMTSSFTNVIVNETKVEMQGIAPISEFKTQEYVNEFAEGQNPVDRKPVGSEDCVEQSKLDGQKTGKISSQSMLTSQDGVSVGIDTVALDFNEGGSEISRMTERVASKNINLASVHVDAQNVADHVPDASASFLCQKPANDDKVCVEGSGNCDKPDDGSAVTIEAYAATLGQDVLAKALDQIKEIYRCVESKLRKGRYPRRVYKIDFGVPNSPVLSRRPTRQRAPDLGITETPIPLQYNDGGEGEQKCLSVTTIEHKTKIEENWKSVTQSVEHHTAVQVSVNQNIARNKIDTVISQDSSTTMTTVSTQPQSSSPLLSQSLQDSGIECQDDRDNVAVSLSQDFSMNQEATVTQPKLETLKTSGDMTVSHSLIAGQVYRDYKTPGHDTTFNPLQRVSFSREATVDVHHKLQDQLRGHHDISQSSNFEQKGQTTQTERKQHGQHGQANFEENSQEEKSNIVVRTVSGYKSVDIVKDESATESDDSLHCAMESMEIRYPTQTVTVALDGATNDALDSTAAGCEARHLEKFEDVPDSDEVSVMIERPRKLNRKTIASYECLLYPETELNQPAESVSLDYTATAEQPLQPSVEIRKVLSSMLGHPAPVLKTFSDDLGPKTSSDISFSPEQSSVDIASTLSEQLSEETILDRKLEEENTLQYDHKIDKVELEAEDMSEMISSMLGHSAPVLTEFTDDMCPKTSTDMNRLPESPVDSEMSEMLSSMLVHPALVLGDFTDQSDGHPKEEDHNPEDLEADHSLRENLQQMGKESLPHYKENVSLKQTEQDITQLGISANDNQTQVIQSEQVTEDVYSPGDRDVVDKVPTEQQFEETNQDKILEQENISLQHDQKMDGLPLEGIGALREDQAAPRTRTSPPTSVVFLKGQSRDFEHGEIQHDKLMVQSQLEKKELFEERPAEKAQLEGICHVPDIVRDTSLDVQVQQNDPKEVGKAQTEELHTDVEVDKQERQKGQLEGKEPLGELHVEVEGEDGVLVVPSLAILSAKDTSTESANNTTSTESDNWLVDVYEVQKMKLSQSQGTTCGSRTSDSVTLSETDTDALTDVTRDEGRRFSNDSSNYTVSTESEDWFEVDRINRLRFHPTLSDKSKETSSIGSFGLSDLESDTETLTDVTREEMTGTSDEADYVIQDERTEDSETLTGSELSINETDYLINNEPPTNRETSEATNTASEKTKILLGEERDNETVDKSCQECDDTSTDGSESVLTVCNENVMTETVYKVMPPSFAEQPDAYSEICDSVLSGSDARASICTSFDSLQTRASVETLLDSNTAVTTASLAMPTSSLNLTTPCVPQVMVSPSSIEDKKFLKPLVISDKPPVFPTGRFTSQSPRKEDVLFRPALSLVHDRIYTVKQDDSSFEDMWTPNTKRHAQALKGRNLSELIEEQKSMFAKLRQMRTSFDQFLHEVEDVKMDINRSRESSQSMAVSLDENLAKLRPLSGIDHQLAELRRHSEGEVKAKLRAENRMSKTSEESGEVETAEESATVSAPVMFQPRIRNANEPAQVDTKSEMTNTSAPRLFQPRYRALDQERLDMPILYTMANRQYMPIERSISSPVLSPEIPRRDFRDTEDFTVSSPLLSPEAGRRDFYTSPKSEKKPKFRVSMEKTTKSSSIKDVENRRDFYREFSQSPIPSIDRKGAGFASSPQLGRVHVLDIKPDRPKSSEKQVSYRDLMAQYETGASSGYISARDSSVPGSAHSGLSVTPLKYSDSSAGVVTNRASNTFPRQEPPFRESYADDTTVMERSEPTLPSLGQGLGIRRMLGGSSVPSLRSRSLDSRTPRSGYNLDCWDDDDEVPRQRRFRSGDSRHRGRMPRRDGGLKASIDSFYQRLMQRKYP